jgi:putative transposase
LREGARYHVTARADHRDFILESSSVKELFLSVLRRARRKYDFRIENFCIMGNHVHLIILPGKGESLSAIMRWILSVFAMAYNRSMHITGHVWGSRFFSRIIPGFREFVEVFSYIDVNPQAAGLIEDRRQWRYGGLWHRRRGARGILDEPPPGIELLFPEHQVLLMM